MNEKDKGEEADSQKKKLGLSWGEMMRIVYDQRYDGSQDFAELSEADLQEFFEEECKHGIIDWDSEQYTGNFACGDDHQTILFLDTNPVLWGAISSTAGYLGPFLTDNEAAQALGYKDYSSLPEPGGWDDEEEADEDDD